MCGYCANSMSFRKNRVNWIAHVLTCENNGTKRKTDFNRRFFKQPAVLRKNREHGISGTARGYPTVTLFPLQNKLLRYFPK